jgi:hypothetical protein
MRKQEFSGTKTIKRSPWDALDSELTIGDKVKKVK